MDDKAQSHSGGGSPMITDHQASVYIDDQSGFTIHNVMLVHQLSGIGMPTECGVWTSNDLTNQMQINFQSGFGSSDDYWGIMAYLEMFTDDGDSFFFAVGRQSKGCNFTGDDANGVGCIRFAGSNVNNFSVTIVPPKSSNCDFLAVMIPD